MSDIATKSIQLSHDLLQPHCFLNNFDQIKYLHVTDYLEYNSKSWYKPSLYNNWQLSLKAIKKFK